ncbi:MAG: ECF transporter S component [Bacillota bacterium]
MSDDLKPVVGSSPVHVKKVHPAVIAVWAAFIAITGLLPVIPVIGTGATFSLADAAVVLAGVMFGPVFGTLSAAIGSFIGQLIAPHSAVFGVLSFIPSTLVAFTAGLLMLRKWNYVMGIFILAIIVWLLFPLGREAWFQITHWIITLIIVYPAGRWGMSFIKSGDIKKMYIGVFLISFVGCMAAHALGCIMAIPMFQLPREVWLAVMPIVIPQRIVFAILAGVIGVPLLIGLPKIGITVGPKLLEEESGQV